MMGFFFEQMVMWPMVIILILLALDWKSFWQKNKKTAPVEPGLI